MLVSTTELAARLEQADTVVIDCRADLSNTAAGFRQYLEGHIPGARHVALDVDLSDPPGDRGRHPLPSIDRFCGLLGRLGVANSSNVVVYDQSTSMFACRMWWMLRWVGHAQVSVLNGGFVHWQAYGLPLSAETPTIEPVDFEPGPSLTRIVRVDDVLAHQGVLVDARATDRFRGKNETIDHRSGHIPNAVCRPFANNLHEDGTFNVEHSQFTDLEPAANVVCYCGSGVSATHNIFAMLLAEHPEPALYPGSWSEWIEDRERPIAS